jgi:hypothetical protein
MASCSIPECEQPAVKRSWCEKHYLRWRRHGDPLETKWDRKTGTPAERFLAKIRKPDGEDGCWRFDGYHMPNGYARFNVRPGVVVLAHRYAYELHYGCTLPPKSSGMELDHLCRARWCVNPTHLELVTKTENIRRGESGANCSAKTHCPQGHPYDEVNTRDYKGRRVCIACAHQRSREWRLKQRGLRGSGDRSQPQRGRDPSGSVG